MKECVANFLHFVPSCGIWRILDCSYLLPELLFDREAWQLPLKLDRQLHELCEFHRVGGAWQLLLKLDGQLRELCEGHCDGEAWQLLLKLDGQLHELCGVDHGLVVEHGVP